MSDTNTLPPEEDDFLDGCELDFEEGADFGDPSIRALFPAGEADAGLESEWKILFADENLRSIAPLTAQAYTNRTAEKILGVASIGHYSGTGRDTGLAARLRALGLVVVEVAGWQTRGSETFHPRGSVDHHTAGPKSGNSPSLTICINGRPDLAGPLCNVYIARDNTVYVVAAGRANHAGTGSYKGLSGNSNVYGVERENVGTGAEPWRRDQHITAAKVHLAFMQGGMFSSDHSCMHKEWTSRKVDTVDFTGDILRQFIKEVSAPVAPAPTHGDEEEMLKSQIVWIKDPNDPKQYHPHHCVGNTAKYLGPGFKQVELLRFLKVEEVGLPGGLETEWAGLYNIFSGPLKNV